ncbi:hypothetical protein COY07_01690 [Candidatus Peregrinibacteria bacterium CG_4_10_14_0_2_um_filter_43_11]|nr:MAG: hypothetical protein COY07_01690 [Candidatus Peregrinibacteria bacterium CG_4_10_14_0_2_um_filter_43_11]
MKNKIRSKVLRWLLDVLPKGIAVFAIATGAFYVYASSVSFPDVDPYPLNGIVGQFVGVTDSNYSSSINGYSDANKECSVNTQGLEDSHICTAMELFNSYNTDANSTVLDQTGDAWFNNGPPGHDQTLSNDCQGWTSKQHKDYASIWKFDSQRALIFFCDKTDYPFACCK